MRLLLRQFGIGHAHLGHQRRHHLPEEIAAHAEHPAVAQGTADDPAQHVAAALVGRQHAIDDQEGAGADVVGDHAQGFVFDIRCGGQPGRDADQVLEQVDLVVGMLVLQHRGQALQTHAGIHAGRGQRRQRAIGLAVELHEHQVPDFDVAVAILVGRAGGTTGHAGAVVVENLRAGAAGTGIGHLPEIVRCVRRALVVTDAHDARGRHADLLAPDRVGLVVVVIDGHPQAFRRQAEFLREQFPGPGNGLLLEVVAKRPVAQHLEEGVVARGVADLIEVVVLAAGAQAALHISGARVAGLLAAEEHVLELHHARVGEQQRRVVGRHQRGRGHDAVPALTEEFEEAAADFGGFHARAVGCWGTLRGCGPAPGIQSSPSAASSSSVRVADLTVAASNPRRSRNCAARARPSAVSRLAP